MSMQISAARLAVAVLPLAIAACTTGRVEHQRAMPTPGQLADHCDRSAPEPFVEQVADNVWIARGYDLANTILIRTAGGNVVIDPGMSPERAAAARDDLLAAAPGTTAALIYTHSHIDHIGGASVWIEPRTQVWATNAFVPHVLKQYGMFQPTEQRRGQRQFGRNVPPEALPCSALGRQVDLEAALASGMRMPTHTFSGAATLVVGGTRIELHEAHGETHDQLFVWLPDGGILMPGDNFYHAFPNLYTIRGTRPRPVDAWITSLDTMRRLKPELLVPSHTWPVAGTAAIQTVLTDYRDGIQWVRDSVIRRANAGERPADFVPDLGLPPHLADRPFLAELYGQIDWSARAIFGSELGWFDGTPADLYPVAASVAAAREVALMGGAAAVAERAEAAMADDPRWALHLANKLREAAAAGPAAAAEPGIDGDRLDAIYAAALRKVAEGVANTNGRGYLLQSALEVADPPAPLPPPTLADELLEGIPVRTFFEVMTVRLMPAEAMAVHESVVFDFPESGQRFIITIRKGVAELAVGDPLPGTPEPVATVKTDTLTWKRLAVQMESPVKAIASGRLKLSGSRVAFLRFIDRFDREL